ncbi:hypothetical protein [Salipiger mucosus]|uniref:Uncharacterized protein n=1 Tax=Salipiger mucosus DSM 16094 TaxID=1123237 RepID=S9QQG7_9RHOB|nr:hypothetical protein [Salipiger mucosus]EPX81897.1 hypothetical protein Salmuc_00211 [Salipiger mucosus DSM 16094]
MTAFDPHPVLLAFVFVKTFVYLELVAVLALLRLAFSARWSRLAAFLAMGLALAGIAITLAPVMNLASHPAYAPAARFMAGGQGMWGLLLPSVPLAASAMLPRPRARWIDLVHALALWGLVGLWIATRLV